MLVNHYFNHILLEAYKHKKVTKKMSSRKSKVAPMWEEPLDGDTFSKMITSGCHNIIMHQEELNTTNVFPIPDGDTGANMASAGKHMISALKKFDEGAALGDRALAVAKACLMGGRGNSGTLLTYLFNQISKALDGKETISVLKSLQ